MKDIVAIISILIILGLALIYIIRARKKGVKCIGCPSGTDCASKRLGECSGSCCNCPDTK